MVALADCRAAASHSFFKSLLHAACTYPGPNDCVFMQPAGYTVDIL